MIIDLTKPIYDGMPVYDNDPKVTLKSIANIENDGYQNHLLIMNVHAGTHVDGLAHMLESKPMISSYPLTDFIGLARYVSDEDLYHNQGEDMLVVKMMSTSLNESFVQAIIQSKIKLIVIEHESVDQAPYAIHKILFNHGILIVENAINIDVLKDYKLFKLYAIPLKIDSDASPVRLFAETIK